MNEMDTAVLRETVFGRILRRPATTLVQNTTTPLFNVAGGHIAITSLVGVVTTAIANTASLTAKLVHTPSGGSVADLAAATGVTADAVGTFWSLTTTAAADLLSEQTTAGSEAPNVTYAPLLNSPIILGAGAIALTVSNHDPGTGAAKWYITYVPFDVGAYVSLA